MNWVDVVAKAYITCEKEWTHDLSKVEIVSINWMTITMAK